MANSKIYLGSTNIGSLFQGADDISIYLGENKVYPLEEPFKWKAIYADSHTESAQCDSTSEIAYREINGTGLTSVEIGNCTTSIGGRAFYQYSGLTFSYSQICILPYSSASFQIYPKLPKYTFPNSTTTVWTKW